MKFHESENLELKQIVDDSIKKEIIAFANAEGGKIIVGVGDDGTIIGLENPDTESLKISNMVRDSILPDVTMFIHYSSIIESGKKLLEIDVQRGTKKPYYLESKGLKPSGVYTRQGFSSAPASQSAILNMIKETDGDRFEEMRSLNQELSFASAKAEFRENKIKFGKSEMKTLNLSTADGVYTNLALLLSDQCMHSIKAAVFQGNDQTIFRDRREFTGSLFEQLKEGISFIEMNNKTRASIEGMKRIDSRDYPEIAIREALLNAVIHRDYGVADSTLISIYDNRTEIISIGGLMSDFTSDDLFNGISICRNRNLANVFYRLKWIEAYGTGIRKIMDSYRDSLLKPEFIITGHTFKVVLPNRNFMVAGKPNGSNIDSDSPEQDRIMEILANEKRIKREDIQNDLGISISSAIRLLKKMTEEGKIKRVGNGKNTEYIRK